MKDPNVKPLSNGPDSTTTGFLLRLKSHDSEAWSRLARLYGPLVYSWCRRRGLQSEDSADVVQEVFRAVAINVGHFVHGSGSTFRGWLWTITRHKILDYYRKLQRNPGAVGGSDIQEFMNQLPESIDDAEPETRATGDLVHRALELIKPDFSETTWQAFWRVIMDDRPPGEVAESLGMSVNAVYIAKSRVLGRLRDELGEDCL